MPAISNIVIADNVPTNHTLKPLTASLPLSTWMETTATISREYPPSVEHVKPFGDETDITY